MTQNEKILKSILETIEVRPYDLPAFQDAFSCIRNISEEKGEVQVKLIHNVRRKLAKLKTEEAQELIFRMMCYTAPESFDDFMLYIEHKRPPKEQFWLPRRAKLLPIGNALQEMEYGDLDELFLSQPPRTGKSTLMMFFVAWVMGRNSERSNLYCSYTDSVVAAMYNGILEILTDTTTYAFYDVFNTKIASTNAADLMLNLDRKKRYASFTGRSLYGTLNGACDCNGFLIADDLHSGIEEVLSPTRLKSAWDKVDNNLLPRAKQHAKIVWEGTRWSLSDCIQRRINLLETDPNYARRKFKIVNIPALDENDQSNFDYDYGVGFDSQFYQQRRASFAFNDDMASWLAQYQGEPIERNGAVFNPSSLRYYNGVLPEADPDRIFMAVDPAYGGGDFTAATVIYQFADDLYVADVIFDDGEKNVTQPLIVNAIKKHNVQAVKIEGTKMTASYGEEIEKTLKEEGIRINLQINTNHFTGNGKRQRIFDTAPEIREKMVFLSAGSRSKIYEKFMNNVFSFTIEGKQAKHDDAPDVLAMSVKMAFNSSRKVEVFMRPF